MRCLDSITNSMDLNLSKFQRYGRPGKPGTPADHGVRRGTEAGIEFYIISKFLNVIYKGETRKGKRRENMSEY